MNILNKFTWTASAILLGGVVYAQNPMVNDQAQTAPQQEATSDAVNDVWKPSLVKDGIIDYVPHVNKPLQLNNVREIDVAWKRRVWREIDVRQKQNQPFIYRGDEFSGGGSFIEILLDAVKKGKVAAYSNIDDRFTTPLSMDEFEKSIGGKSDTVMVTDPITGEQKMQITKTEFDVTSVTRYRVKEDWIFDRNLGRMVVRIIGIAPLQDIRDETTGAYIGTNAMFWVYYPELRNILANYEVYNPQNDVRRMSWADYFDGHYFQSYVIKVSSNNPRGAQLSRDLRGLQEGQNLMNEIYEKEMDMWEE